jgi:MFS family permease
MGAIYNKGVFTNKRGKHIGILHMIDDTLAKRNTFILAIAGALAGANSVVTFATAAIVGYAFAPDKSLATLPVSIYVLGLVAAALPLGMSVNRYGRRVTFQLATLFGVATGLVSAYATYQASFTLLCFGTFLAGCYAAAVQSYRFAAADTASPAFRPKAISWVMAGGILAAVIGPQLVIYTKGYVPQHLFFVTYFAQSAVALIAFGVVSLLKFPPHVVNVIKGGRSTLEIAKQPRFIIAVICGIAAYMTMNFVMTAAPLAMKLCGHSVEDSALGIQWHVLGMFVPSLFTGNLIVRFGASRVVGLGLLMLFASAMVAVSGLAIWNFNLSLILLGVGWNFGFIGASAMLAECHAPEERASVQAFYDFLVFGAMAIGSFASGQILVNGGWNVVNYAILPFLAVALASLLMRKRLIAV